MKPAHIKVIIVAGGSGLRFGGTLPKQYALLNGKPVLQHTLEAFRRLIPGTDIVTVVAADMRQYWVDLCQEHKYEPGPLAIGGSTRWESVKNGLGAFGQLPSDTIVLVHDAARPLVSRDIIQGVIDAIERGVHGAVPAIEPADSFRVITSTGNEPLDRSRLRAVQTPQAFRFDVLQRAFSLPYSTTFTDEATMVQQAGFANITLVKGSPLNFKITQPVDLLLASQLMENAQPA